MKELLTVRSNAILMLDETSKEFNTVPRLELVLIHTDGKKYRIDADNLITEQNVEESRLMVSPTMLNHLITDLQLHQSKMNALQQHSDSINTLAKYIPSNPSAAVPADEK